MVQRSAKFRLAAAALAVVVSVLGGACVATKTAAPAPKPDRGIKFSHEIHKDLGCTDCHTLENRHASLPWHDVCGTCHEINMDEPDEQACAFCHTREGYEILERTNILDEENQFSHQAHEAAEVTCDKCHANPDRGALATAALKPFCMDCHGKVDPKLNECGVCHTKINRETIPQFRGEVRIQHDAPVIWQNIHGQESRVNPQYCALCHDQAQSCDACHQTNPPDNHTVTFRRRTHGLQATWDRQRCAACHEEDSCRRCHEHTAPESHRGDWGGNRNTHCIQCHYPPEKTNCTVCHEEIDHDKAMPSPHAFGIFPPRCARCHPGGVPYRAPHLQNSTVRCAWCHR